MNKEDLLREIKSYFGQMVIEKHLYKKTECLYLAIELMQDLSNEFMNVDKLDFSTFTEDDLQKILDRLKSFDKNMNKFRKVH